MGRHALLLLGCITGLLAGITAPASVSAEPPALSRLWKGKELWPFAGQHGKYEGTADDPVQSMPGVTLSFSYAGKGPLPPPQELVVKLDKPLPLGTYRLFVKNFYVGKMEAVLGDITHPLDLRRYEWTPGKLFETNAGFDKIVLRFFPNQLFADTGARQQQNYIIQGVFLTTDTSQVPIRGGDIITTLPVEKPAARAGNYMRNGSFETGLFPWGKPFGIAAAYGVDNLDASMSAEGACSFKLLLTRPKYYEAAGERVVLESKNYRLPPGPYTLSFHAKADRPILLTASVQGATDDMKGNAPAGLAKTVQLSSEWQRYSVTADLKALTGFLYTVRFAAPTEPATLWLDAVQLQNGALTDFRPAEKTEVGYVCSVPGHIYYEGQGSDVEVLVHDQSAAKQATVRYRVFDYWGQVVDEGQKAVDLTEKHGKARLSLFAKKRGIFRVLFSSGDSTAEMTYSVLPPNLHLGKKYPQGTLGVDTHFDDKQLAILKRANFNWAITKFLGRWYLVEKESGKYHFDDESVAAANRAGMSVLIQPHISDWGIQPWLKPLWKPEGGAAWQPEKKQEFMQRWGRFMHQLVRHFKGAVKHWEIDNEPFSLYAYDDYAEVLRIAAEQARQADPEAKIVALSGGGYDRTGYDRVLKLVDPASLDVFSVHFYGNQLREFTDYAQLLKKHQKPGWNTETGATCPTFFTTLPEYDALWQKDYWEQVQRDSRQITINDARNYLLSMSIGGMDRHFYYFARFVNSGPSQPVARFGGGKELTEFDGSLKPNAVALSIASHFLDDAKRVGLVELDARLQVYLFEKGNESVGFISGRPEQALTLAVSAKLRCYDIMGNAIAAGPLRVIDSPVYFRFQGSPQACVKLLRQTTVATENKASPSERPR